MLLDFLEVRVVDKERIEVKLNTSEIKDGEDAIYIKLKKEEANLYKSEESVHIKGELYNIRLEYFKGINVYASPVETAPKDPTKVGESTVENTLNGANK